MAKEKNKIENPTAKDGDLRALLLETRQQAGYSISQMADALCLSENVINNLEGEDFALLPEPPYVRGYLRNYAKLGEKIDPDKLISTYEVLRGADVSELSYQANTATSINKNPGGKLSPILFQLLFLALLLVGIGFLSTIPEVSTWFKDTWSGLSNQITSKPSDSTGNPLLTGTMPIPLPLDIPTKDEKTESSNQATSSTNTIGNSTSTTKKPITETLDKPVKSKKVAETNKGDQLKIKLIFNKEVWMRIKDKDNKTIFESTNQAGSKKSLRLKKPLTFRVGNAQGMSLFVDDKAIDISTYIDAGGVANFTLE